MWVPSLGVLTLKTFTGLVLWPLRIINVNPSRNLKNYICAGKSGLLLNKICVAVPTVTGSPGEDSHWGLGCQSEVITTQTAAVTTAVTSQTSVFSTNIKMHDLSYLHCIHSWPIGKPNFTLNEHNVTSRKKKDYPVARHHIDKNMAQIPLYSLC